MTTRLLRVLLGLAPLRFRERYRDELLAVHRARAERPRRWVERTLFGVREVFGAAVLVLRLRLGAGPRHAGTTTTGGRGMLEHMWQDLRFAGRSLRRNPGFTLAAVGVLALGIGAGTAIFSAANAWFFRPLPFAGEDRLVTVFETNPEFGWTHAQAAPANALDWREQVEAFQDLAVYSEFVGDATLIRDGEPELLGYTNVSGNFFDVLGVPAALGRTFRFDETWAGSDGVVVLSHSAWANRFGSDPSVVGRTLELSGTPVEVVGVMPPGFSFPSPEVDLWTPFGWEAGVRDAAWFRRAHFVRPVVRLAPGATLEEADAQLQVVAERLAEAYPGTNAVMGAGLMGMRDFMVREVRTPLVVLLGSVAVLLLLAAINVANLTLVRAQDRGREVALRYALGAGRGRVVRLLLSESFLLAVAGGVAGLGLGWAGVRFMERLTPLGIQGATAAALDWRVLLFAAGSAGGAALFFGAAPALRSLGGRIQEGLRDGGRGGTRGRGLRGVRALVVAEVALALLLVVGAGLMVRSFVHLRGVDPGFTPEGALAVQFTVPSARYPERDQVIAFYDGFLEALEARPGIERAGTVGHLPLDGSNWTSQFQAEGWPPERVGFEIVHRRADRGYFEALDIPLVRGRLFGPGDGPDAPLVVVVNETFAREHFPGEDPIGQKIAYDRDAAQDPDGSVWYEIVGIVGDQHQESPAVPVEAEVFENRSQDWGRDSWVVLRTSAGDATDAVATVRAVLREMDPLIPMASVRPLDQVWRASMEREEFILSLLSVFGVVALLLATVGVYGVTAQAARTRTREIGIRMALGAAGGDVLGMVLRQSLTLVALGLALGLGAALVASRALETLLYGVEPNDPWTLASVVLLLGAAATAACYLPARRATAVDPVRSLRAE